MITATLVKELRDMTSAGMMDCKRALQENDGNLDAAAKWLREKGISKAAKKAGRDAKEGIIFALIDENAQSGVLAEVNCETDFVAKNDNFQAFVADLVGTVAASGAADIETALALPKGDGTVETFVQSKVIELGENLRFRRMARFEVAGTGIIASYIHLGGKVGVLLEVGCDNAATTSADGFRDLVKDLTLHIAAAAPAGLSADDIPADLVEAEKDIFRTQLANDGKPAEMIEKIIPGKMAKFFAEKCLLEQGFVREPDTTIKQLLESSGKDLGDTLTIRRFVRFGVGE
jgi:elongation factor Ts